MPSAKRSVCIGEAHRMPHAVHVCASRAQIIQLGKLDCSRCVPQLSFTHVISWMAARTNTAEKDVVRTDRKSAFYQVCEAAVFGMSAWPVVWALHGFPSSALALMRWQVTHMVSPRSSTRAQGEDNPNVTKLADILHTYLLYDPDLGKFGLERVLLASLASLCVLTPASR